MEFAPRPAVTVELLDSPAEDGDFRLDGEDGLDIAGAAQLHQPRRQAFGAGERFGGFRQPLLLHCVARLRPMHLPPLPPTRY